jgi:hypothetical protein
MLNRLAAEHATGVLVRERGTLYLSEGRVVHAESPATPGIDVLLTAAGAVDAEGWQRAVEGAEADPERPVGRTLISQGVLSQGQLELCHLGTLFDAAYFALAPSSAPGQFRYGAWHWMGPVRPVPVSALERETMRRRSLLNRIWPDPSTDTAPLTLVLPARPAQVGTRRRAILDLVDGRRTATDIARELGRPAFHTLVDLRRLAAAGLVAAAHRPAPPPSPVTTAAADTGTAAATGTATATGTAAAPPARSASPQRLPAQRHTEETPGEQRPAEQTRAGHPHGGQLLDGQSPAGQPLGRQPQTGQPLDAQPSAGQSSAAQPSPAQPSPAAGHFVPQPQPYAERDLPGQLAPQQFALQQLLPPTSALEQPTARTRAVPRPSVRPGPLVPPVQPLPPPAPQPAHPVSPPDDRAEQSARNHPDVDTLLPRRPSGGRHRAGRTTTAPVAPVAPTPRAAAPGAPAVPVAPAAPAVPSPRTPAAAPSPAPPTHFADPDVTLLRRLRAALEAL